MDHFYSHLKKKKKSQNRIQILDLTTGLQDI